MCGNPLADVLKGNELRVVTSSSCSISRGVTIVSEAFTRSVRLRLSLQDSARLQRRLT